MSKKNKKKKQKITYVDDGRTIADMSAIDGRADRGNTPRQRSSARDKWTTYKNSVKMMFVPMLVTLLGISVIFLILYIVFSIPEWTA